MPDKDDSSRHEKKSETIEARLPFTTKRALLARCKAEGKSVSNVLRLCVENYLASPTQTERKARQTMTIFKHIAGAAAVVGSIMIVHHGAMAQSDSHFGALDNNADGRVALAEITAAHDDVGRRPAGMSGHASHGAAMHTNAGAEWHQRFVPEAFAATAGADDALAPDEMRAFHDRVRDSAFAAIDGNGNGVIERAEMAPVVGEPSEAAMAHADTNKDGRITRAEFIAAHSAHSRH
jgi:hypothetical protein